ncbi:type II toxin-antitoxin system RelE/ParE family toxin [Bradyrhizobium yuanmingense]|uniref:type II toxin-antitoxin system RelE/ParE family toxin n=1 Tax=Bradyrhizobium yuanmingense TaxID=108015 RepID=UPI001FD98760|nr:type II toxin-antitoxin system RelE/ParE family toxin [Bradyrhizobium yuanmingense]
MAEYRLSERTRADLIDIYDFTESRFGKYQAEAYYAGLIRSFGLLADFPVIGQQVDELAAGHRRFRFQSHLIFYTVQPDHVESAPFFMVRKTSDRSCSTRDETRHALHPSPRRSQGPAGAHQPALGHADQADGSNA